jgi:hypothetical protein
MPFNEGEFFSGITAKRSDSDYLKHCMRDAIQKLIDSETDVDKPGMLLGNIQSGKTRAFIGIIALAFDNGYHMAVVLTKGTRALAKQTYIRLKLDFADFCRSDRVEICDIMHLPNNYTGYELQKKLIIVVKKEVNNMRRIIEALISTYPDLSQRRLLIIDDEADYASIGFRTNKEGLVEINKIARQINELRKRIASYDFLQVTATPYSLYLQPETPIVTHEVFRAIRPAFTVILPNYEGYIGGDFYFEKSEDKTSSASCLYEPVPREELDLLRAGRRLGRADRRTFRVEDVLLCNHIYVLRKAIMNFIVGACIRRIHQENTGEMPSKYSFIVHTEYSKASHAWQEEIVKKIKELLRVEARNRSLLDGLIKTSYDDIAKSINLERIELPSLDLVREKVNWILNEDCLMISKVNSERQAEELLDDTGQLRLRAPINIFIGGQILDRGLTIENLIGFYYGRRAQRVQQDTVMQHSRMYGNRARADLAVTRFYTAQEIYETMKRIHELDIALREAFERGAQEEGVVFIHTDPQNRVVPCSPNKILLSATTTVRPFKRLLPIGFQIDYAIRAENILRSLDKRIESVTPTSDQDVPFLLNNEDAQLIIDDIVRMHHEEGLPWDVRAFKATMEYLSLIVEDDRLRGKVWCLVRTNRYASRTNQDGTFYDAPDTAHVEGRIAREYAINNPMLMLFRQNGQKEQGWRGVPFWWPVLMAPKKTRTVVYSSTIIEPPAAA